MARKYHFYTQPAKNKVICVSHFAGKPVRGVAICSEHDEFNEETGRKLAQARCDLAMSKLRVRDRNAEVTKAYAERDAAYKRADKANERLMDAFAMLQDAENAVTHLINQIG